MKPHPVRVVHLVFGLLLVAFLTLWAMVETDAIDQGELHWLIPVPFLVLGAAGLGLSLVRAVRKR